MPALVKSDRGRSVKFVYRAFGSFLQSATFFWEYIMVGLEIYENLSPMPIAGKGVGIQGSRRPALAFLRLHHLVCAFARPAVSSIWWAFSYH